MDQLRLTVITEREDDGRYSVYVPDLPGCASWGETRDEALVNIRDAIEVYVGGLKADGQSIPQPRSSVEAVSIQVA